MRNINPNSVIASSIVDITFFFLVQLPKNLSILIKTKLQPYLNLLYDLSFNILINVREEYEIRDKKKKTDVSREKVRTLWFTLLLTRGDKNKDFIKGRFHGL